MKYRMFDKWGIRTILGACDCDSAQMHFRIKLFFAEFRLSIFFIVSVEPFPQFATYTIRDFVIDLRDEADTKNTICNKSIKVFCFS